MSICVSWKASDIGTSPLIPSFFLSVIHFRGDGTTVLRCLSVFHVWITENCILHIWWYALQLLSFVKVSSKILCTEQNLISSVHWLSVKQCAKTRKQHINSATEFWCLDTRTPIYLTDFVSTYNFDGLSRCCSLHLIETIHSHTTFSSHENRFFGRKGSGAGIPYSIASD